MPTVTPLVYTLASSWAQGPPVKMSSTAMGHVIKAVSLTNAPAPGSVVVQMKQWILPLITVTLGKSIHPFGLHLLEYNLELEHHSGYLSLNIYVSKSWSLNRSVPSLVPNTQLEEENFGHPYNLAKEPWPHLVHQVISLRDST